jgi:hypothetical protein
MSLTTSARSFARDERGAIAIVFSLTAFIALMLVGISIDYGRGVSLRTSLQATVDSAALNAVASGEDAAEAQLGEVRNALARRAGSFGAASADVATIWLSSNDYQVLAWTSMPTSFLSAVPGLPTELTIIARSVARGHKLKVVADPPSKTDVSYEAADYNQVWVYCYDKDWQRNGTRSSVSGTKFDTPTGNLAFTKDLASLENRAGRSDFTLVADNGSNSYTFAMPQCKEHETISYMLYNSRNNRTSPSRWSRNYTTCGTSLAQTGKSCYSWYTDTRIDAAGVESHVGTSPYQLETVLCNDANCTSLTDGGYIPANHSVHRIPQKVSKKCEPGKFMYFGWEDRPPQNQGGLGTGQPYPVGQADPGGDRDYDDIRLIVSCPRSEKDTVNVRLIE